MKKLVTYISSKFTAGPFRIPSSRIYYLSTFGEMMNTLRIQLISLALFVVAYTFLEFLGKNPSAIYTSEFWIRVALLLLATAFTAYDAIAFHIYARGKVKASKTTGNVLPIKVILLFFFELLMFAINAYIIAMPLITLRSSVYSSNVINIYHIFALTSAWHLVNIIWYSIDPSDVRDFIRHIGYSLINLILFLMFKYNCLGSIFSGSGKKQEFFVLACYALIVFCIYIIQVRFYINADIKKIASINSLQK